MFDTILEKGRFCFHDKFSTWEEAIEASCIPLMNEKVIDERYVKAIIDCVKEYGPYIVIAPNIAMPHASENAQGVNSTAISFMKVEEPVHFDESDKEKDACLFFVLAATDAEMHLKNMMELVDYLSDENLVKELLNVHNAEQLEEVVRHYKQ